MSSKVVISNISFLSFLLAILNIFDLWFLSLNVISLNVNVFQILTIGCVGIIYYINAKKLNLLQIKLFTFFIIYLIFQLLNSFFSNTNLLSSLSVFFILIFTSYITLSLRNYSNQVLDKFVFLVTKYTIFLMIFFDLMNHIVGGNSLFQIFQNNAPILFMNLIVLYYYINNKEKKSLIRLFLLYTIWTAISYILGYGELRVQYKSILLLSLVIFTLIFIIKFKSLLPTFNTRFMLKYLTPFLFLLIITASLMIASYAYELIIEFIPRRGSGETRIAVAEVMFIETIKNVFSLIFGQGIGSSHTTYLINGDEFVKPHSGLMILFYEQGIFGLFFSLLFGLSFFIRKKILLFNFNYKRGEAFFFLLILALLWIIQNIVYIIGFPAPQVFHQSQIMSYILLATFLSNKLFRPDNKC